MGSTAPRVIRLAPGDNVVIACDALEQGAEVTGEGITCRQTIPAGHKLATQPIDAGQPVFKYGQIIGSATAGIDSGEHVHTHNMGMALIQQYATAETADIEPAAILPVEEQARFQGIVRSDGQIATRNYIGVLATSACSASVARYVADAFDEQRLKPYPRVDGVVALAHGSGCGMPGHGDGFEILQRTLCGWARHPNFAGILLVGLGCEINQLDGLMGQINPGGGKPVTGVNIQELGGTRKTVAQGVAAVSGMLAAANGIRRVPLPASHLVVGLECGGSDGYSGITANPALGVASDLLVRNGATVILSELPEIYGAEHLLIRRARSRAVADRLVERIRWWEAYTAQNGAELNNNPSPGNQAGGLTTILEKSLGAVAKAGSTPLMDVAGFGEKVTAKGLVFMDTPGYDVVSVTGMIAGGAHMICFTTGRGSVFGSKPVPTLKLASNTAMYRRLADDMDINCGGIVDGDASLADVGQRIFKAILEAAGGQQTRSEALGFGDAEFVPWQLGATL